MLTFGDPGISPLEAFIWFALEGGVLSERQGLPWPGRGLRKSQWESGLLGGMSDSHTRGWDKVAGP